MTLTCRVIGKQNPRRHLSGATLGATGGQRPPRDSASLGPRVTRQTQPLNESNAGGELGQGADRNAEQGVECGGTEATPQRANQVREDAR